MIIYFAGITGMAWDELEKFERERVLLTMLLTYANIKVFPKLQDNEKKMTWIIAHVDEGK